MAFLKRKLSGSTNGLGIKVAGTGTGDADTLHQAIAGTTAGTYDEIWLFAYNGHTSTVVLTIEFGGTSAPDQNIVCTLAAQSGLQLVVPGFILQNALYVKAFAATTAVVVMYGFVNTFTD